MAYSPDPTNPFQPTTKQLAGNMAYELQALKGYIQSLISAGSNFNNMIPGRNRLINPNFMWSSYNGQSGTVPANTTNYTCDRWTLTTSPGNNCSWARDPVSNFFGVGSPTMRLTPNVGSTFVILSQKIESISVQDFVAGDKLTVSGYAYVTDTSINRPYLKLQVPAVTADDWSSVTTILSDTTVNTAGWVANTWNYFSYTFTLTSDFSEGVAVQLVIDGSCANKTMWLGKIQAEKGSLASPFEFRPAPYDQILINRYRTSSLIYNSFNAAAANEISSIAIQFSPLLRTVPTISFSDISMLNCTHNTPNSASTNTANIFLKSSGAGLCTGNFTAVFDAEL